MFGVWKTSVRHNASCPGESLGEKRPHGGMPAGVTAGASTPHRTDVTGSTVEEASTAKEPSDTSEADARSQFDQSFNIWPPVRSVVYSEGAERQLDVYFPLELSNLDYTTRILQSAGHALRQLYAHLMQENLGPPAREGSLPLTVDDMDNPRAFRHALSARAVEGYAKLINMELESFKEAITEIQAADKRLACPPSTNHWTNPTVRKLFDVATRLVACSSSAGFSSHIHRNLSSLSRQYEKHMMYRQERLHASLSASTARKVEDDEGFSPSTPDLNNLPTTSAAIDAGQMDGEDGEDEDSFTERRNRMMARVLACERKVKMLPPMQGSGKEGEEGAVEILSREVEARFVLMDLLRRCREHEAQHMRAGQLKQAEEERIRGRELSERLHRKTDAVQFAWNRVAPINVDREAAHVLKDVDGLSAEAAQDRKYQDAAELKEAVTRLEATRAALDFRRKAAVVEECKAEKRAMVKVFKRDVEDLGVSVSALPALTEESQPPTKLMEETSSVERRIAKLASQWAKEEAKDEVKPQLVPQQQATGSRRAPIRRRRSSVTEYKPAPASAETLELETLSKQARRMSERVHWRNEMCLLVAEIVAASEHDAKKIVLERLAHALEPSQAELAGRVAAMLMEEAQDNLAMCQRMDDWPTLSVAAHEKGRTLVLERRKQKKRWDGTNHKEVKGWMVVTFGEWGRGEVQFREPCGVAVNKQDQYLVSDRSNHRIQVLTASGRLWKTVGSRGSGPGELESPSGVAVGKEGEIVVADRGNNRVVVFSPKGEFLRDIGDGVGSSDTQFQAPSSVAIGPQGEVVVSDYGNHRVKVFTIEGELLRVLGESEDRAERLHYPAGVAVSADGILFVADSGNHRVVALTEDGEVVQEYFGDKGGDLADLHAPLGVTIGAAGEILICDSGHHRVLVLDAEGYLLYCFGFKGQDFGELQCPRGVAVGPHGMLAVADYGNHRLVLCERC